MAQNLDQFSRKSHLRKNWFDKRIEVFDGRTYLLYELSDFNTRPALKIACRIPFSSAGKTACRRQAARELNHWRKYMREELNRERERTGRSHKAG